MPTKNISTNKIIFLTVFASAALMMLVFVFHMRQKSFVPILPPEQGFIFPLAKQIKPFDLLTINDKKFTQRDLLNHWTLLFFGFTHCNSICPMTLDRLNKVYTQLTAQYPNLQVALISLDPERDSSENVVAFAHRFNEAFIGATGEIEEIRKLQSQFNIFSARDKNSLDTNYQILHTTSVILINPAGQWAGVLRYDLKPELFKHALLTSIKTLTS